MNIENLKTIKNFLKFQQTGQTDKAVEMIDDDAAWHSDNIGGSWSGSHYGINAIKRHFKNISSSVSAFKKTPFDLVASSESNFVYEYSYLECTFQHNSKDFETHLISIYEVKDNKIISYRVLEDSNTLYKKYHQK
ncbi:nuclear transport factor 2 family protein [Francisella adeliensis]|uniref:Nuclear transport factor 2 family protein n=1 Tax=Francisella adeliensis TaxID=2007306 RepID=A0A2Z4Y1J4_9GAMM|nr:nuclear transport factor 2 family protein [Francisella adeliensis]AXA34602.1 hypothetical protein CDH04_09430 [Francisella adeliensis]MBK2086327.1 nuclear transport factor 2 family protein [Francisella adeliensis]MBK2096542.1 nuclear transport factor 2 family protein [Francisella adeliensis]QIW12846.1 nuclear transport factor 2 family protein [Francisella adeliensis]QIW14723.1 nuclear transport factor 2 family protein [Francisella adeliensis]